MKDTREWRWEGIQINFPRDAVQVCESISDFIRECNDQKNDTEINCTCEDRTPL